MHARKCGTRALAGAQGALPRGERAGAGQAHRRALSGQVRLSQRKARTQEQAHRRGRLAPCDGLRPLRREEGASRRDERGFRGDEPRDGAGGERSGPQRRSPHGGAAARSRLLRGDERARKRDGQHVFEGLCRLADRRGQPAYARARTAHGLRGRCACCGDAAGRTHSGGSAQRRARRSFIVAHTRHAA